MTMLNTIFWIFFPANIITITCYNMSYASGTGIIKNTKFRKIFLETVN